jgi:glycosyltransferase involved in cell wall biosynthesis
MVMRPRELGLDGVALGDDRAPAQGPTASPVPPASSSRTTPVSVIMCVYRGDRLDPLHDAVCSVLAQTHEDLVLRIYVDGSIAADVRAYLEALADARVRLQFAEMNQGLAVGLNRLIDESLRDGCEVIARMDADDVCYPQRLEKQLAFLDSHPEVDVIGAGCLEVDEDTGEEFLKLLPMDDRTLKRGLVKRTPFVHSTVVFRAQVFAGGTRYRPLASEDMHLWMDLARYGWTFANLPEPLMRYRVSDALFRRRSSWDKVSTELTARLRGMTELCMISPSNLACTGAYLALRLLPVRLARQAYRHLRPRRARA